MTNVACCQLPIVVGDQAGNRRRARAAVTAAAGAGARIVVLPELADSGYVFHDRAEAARYAEPADGATVREWTRLAGELDIVIVGGICELDPAEHVRNSAVIVDAGGLRAVYRKVHLWDREKLVFTPGDEPPPVVATEHGRISVLICYDVEFPEWVRRVALEGADLLCVPTNWPRFPRPPGERPMEAVRVQAAASANRIFVAACDRVGPERGVDWVGASIIVDPDGWPLAGPATGATGTLYATCELDKARDKALTDLADIHADRRPDLYAPITRT